ncbi:MAG: sugar phosphate isomerase/epimerase [Methanosarcinales archaeon]|nr:sugar phosphate isomerase/epimerase [Methanosarcinales archaeon]
MRISCSSLFLWDYRIENSIGILVEAGIENVEFWAETPDFWRQRHEDRAVKNLRDAISVLTERCTVHAPILDLNASSYNEHVCEVTTKETLWAIDLARKLDASVLTVHPGSRTVHRPPTPEDWDRFYHHLTVTTRYAVDAGITMALENLTPRVQSMCHEPVQMAKVLEIYPDLMMTLDIPHALQVDVENAIGFIGQLGERIVNVHIGDVQNGTPHLPGHIVRNPQTSAVLDTLKRSGYDGDLTIEIDDKLLVKQQSREDKVTLLVNEKKYLLRNLQQ